MKLWIGDDPSVVPDDYMYIEDYDDAVSFIHRIKRNRNTFGEKHWDLWTITEINIPEVEAEKYLNLYSFGLNTFRMVFR